MLFAFVHWMLLGHVMIVSLLVSYCVACRQSASPPSGASAVAPPDVSEATAAPNAAVGVGDPDTALRDVCANIAMPKNSRENTYIGVTSLIQDHARRCADARVHVAEGGGPQVITPTSEQRLQARAALLDRLLVATERLGQGTTPATTRLDAAEQLAVGRRQLDTFRLQSRSPVADVFREAFDVIEFTPENEATRSTMRVDQPTPHDNRTPRSGIHDHVASMERDQEGEHRILDGVVDAVRGSTCGKALLKHRAQLTPCVRPETGNVART